MPPLILIVEDEPDIIQALQFSLGREGFRTEAAQTGQDGLRRATTAPYPDLVLLDLMLPDISGTEVCRRIKADPKAQATPVMMLTARGEEIDRIVGFEVGADDYVVKPFSTRELVLRIRAVLRRNTAPAPEANRVLEYGPLRVDLDAHQAWAEGTELALTPLEFKLLTVMMDRSGRVQTRERLIDDVWGVSTVVTVRTVDTHVKRLRKKLGPAAPLIETRRGVGYRFVPPQR